MPVDPLPCAIKRGGKTCGGKPVVREFLGYHYSVCGSCGYGEDRHESFTNPDAAVRQWNEWMETEKESAS